MNAIAKDVQSTLHSLAVMERSKLIETLQNSLYVGATSDSVEMVISYCEATGLDPMQKPVHIVPMWNKKLNRNIDVIMPGIGLYRIQADRSKTLAGTSEPTFGDNITQVFKGYDNEDVEVTYPEWCTVTMKKLVGNHIVEFTAKEYWIENYATAGKTTSPNAMWKKRPKGQLAKCAEAQALRKGWPEIGQAPTAEEMEGRVIDMGAADVVAPDVTMPKAKDKPTVINETASTETKKKPEPVTIDQEPDDNSPKINAGQIKVVSASLDNSGIGQTDFFKQFSISDFADLQLSKINEALDWIRNNGA